MKLKDYLQQQGTGTSYRLAKKLKIQPTNIYMWANRNVNISPARCVQIELLTDGAVTCEELNPNFDWNGLWKIFLKRCAEGNCPLSLEQAS